jgi:hypothetical protein
MSQPHSSIVIENQLYTPNIPKTNDTQSKSSCFKKTQYIIVLAIFVWFILSNVNIGLGITYMNTPICTHQINVTSNKTQNNSFSLITNNTYEIQIEEITPTVNLSIWLIINGYIWQYAIVFSIMYALIDKTQKNTSDCLSYTKYLYVKYFPFIMFIFFFFLFVWMIIGAKSFWSDCGSNINKSIEGWMGMTLVSEILNIIIFVLWCLYKIFQSAFGCCK